MRVISWISIVVLSLVACCGCNVLGFAANGLAGESKTEAKFVPAKKPLVVIAENFAAPTEASLDSDPLARYISDELTEHAVAPIVSPDRVLALETEHPDQYRNMTIAAVGRAAGADQILYVNIIDVDVNFASSADLIKGHGEVRVRIIDAHTGATMWPTDVTEGYSISADTRIIRTAERSETIVRSDVHRALAIRVARLFYATKNE